MRNSDLGWPKSGVRTGECQGLMGRRAAASLGPEVLEEAGEDPLGHAPDDRLPRPGRPAIRGARRGRRTGPSGRCSGAAGGRAPTQLVAATSGFGWSAGRSGQGEDERPDGDRGEDRGAGHHVVQTAEEVGVGEREAHLFLRSRGWRWRSDRGRRPRGGRRAAPCGRTMDRPSARPGGSAAPRRATARARRPRPPRGATRRRPSTGRWTARRCPEPREARAQWLWE